MPLLLLPLRAEVYHQQARDRLRGCTESAASCDCCQNNVTAPRMTSPRTRTLFRRSFSGRISGIWLAAPSATAALSTATAGSRPAAAAAAAPDGCEEPPGCWLLVPAAPLLLPALLRAAAAVAAALLLPAAAAAALLLPAAPAAEGPEQKKAAATDMRSTRPFSCRSAKESVDARRTCCCRPVRCCCLIVAIITDDCGDLYRRLHSTYRVSVVQYQVGSGPGGVLLPGGVLRAHMCLYPGWQIAVLGPLRPVPVYDVREIIYIRGGSHVGPIYLLLLCLLVCELC